MTREEKYLELISLLVDYTRELSTCIGMAPATRKQIEQTLTRVEKIAKEI